MVRKPDPNKRANFLATALRLFAANGVQNTSTAQIAKEADAAAGTLFLYFPTKQDLTDELVLLLSQQQSDYIKSLLDPSNRPARETFLNIWNGSIQWLSDHPEAFQFIQHVRDSRFISTAVIQETAKYLDYYFTAIQVGWMEGSIKPYPGEIIGEFLYQDIVAVMHLIRSQKDPAKQVEIVQAGFDIFWEGIKK